ncbi:MAG: hypothetical protein HQ551_01175 [Desulfobacteraceae bacterium]|nr:hypothetical protein [Desulfobacteraceae bacterium]
MQIQQVVILAYPLLFVNNIKTYPGDKMTLDGGDEKRKAGNNLVTIRGILVPVDWDEKGNVVSVSVSTYDEDEYLIKIERHKKGEELLSLIRKEVEVSGLVHEHEGSKIITVKKYRLKMGARAKENPLNQDLKL